MSNFITINYNYIGLSKVNHAVVRAYSFWRYDIIKRVKKRERERERDVTFEKRVLEVKS